MIITCLDGSPMSVPVCTAAIWAAKRQEEPLLLLHSIEREQQHGTDETSGALGLGASSKLLKKMAELDEQRSKLKLQYGKEILAEAKLRAQAAGLPAEQIRESQRHGDIIEAATDLEEQSSLIVIGRTGENTQGTDFRALGSHIEMALRHLHHPILVVGQEFQPPQNFMLAYDGRERAIEDVSSCKLLQGLKCHLVMVKNNRKKLDVGSELLRQRGFEVETSYLEGPVLEQLLEYKQKQHIDLLVMGAFAHSSVHHFFLGSTTMRMVEKHRAPLLVLR